MRRSAKTLAFGQAVTRLVETDKKDGNVPVFAEKKYVAAPILTMLKDAIDQPFTNQLINESTKTCSMY